MPYNAGRTGKYAGGDQPNLQQLILTPVCDQLVSSCQLKTAVLHKRRDEASPPVLGQWARLGGSPRFSSALKNIINTPNGGIYALSIRTNEENGNVYAIHR